MSGEFKQCHLKKQIGILILNTDKLKHMKRIKEEN